MTGVQRDIESVLETIELLEGQTDPIFLLDTLDNYTRNLGFEYVSIAQILNPAMTSNDLQYYGKSNFPEEWQKNWLALGYAFHDPIVRYALLNRSAFSWSEARQSADKTGKYVHDTSRDYGLFEGLAIPVSIGSRPPGVISLAHNGLDFSEREIAMIELVCIHAYSRFSKLTDTDDFKPTKAQATAREREILHYIASGRTAEQVGKVLGISETTVVKHLSNLSTKFETSNRIHTVTTCIRTGMILP